MPLPLSQAGIISLLACLHDVVPARLGALKGRLQHFQRLGFPAGINTGRGKAAEYGPSAILRLLLAFEMLELGMTPERSIATLRVSNDILIQAAGYTGTFLLNAFGDVDLESPFPEHFFFIFDPMGLGSLTMPAEHSVDTAVIEQTWGRGWWALKSDLDAEAEWPRRSAVVNVTQMFVDAGPHLTDSGVARRELGQALLDWAHSAEWRHRHA